MGRIASHLRALCLKRSKAVEPREYGEGVLIVHGQPIDPDLFDSIVDGPNGPEFGALIHIPFGATPRKLVGREGG